MIESYRPLLYTISLFVALWAQALLSNPLPPEGLYYAALSAATLWLIVGSTRCFKERYRPSAVFILGAALLPHLYYLELSILSSSPDFLPGRLNSVFVVYNVFRYLFLLCAFLAVIKRFLRNLSSFASEEPERPSRR